MKALMRTILALIPILLLAAVPLLASEQTNYEPIPIVDIPSNNVIVFGELHGTNEIPAFFADQVEALLSAEHTVHVGLEMTASDQDGLRATMSLPKEEQHGALLQLEQWRMGRDGRNSLAMAKMIRRLGELQTHFGDRLSLFAYDVSSDWRGDSNDRDQFMASVIGEQRARLPERDYMLVLAGNAHAFGVPGAPWDPDFRSMTVRLKESHPVVTLRNIQSGGNAWICTPECGPKSISGLDQTRTPGIYMEPFAIDWSDQPVYDGVFFVGELSASEPLPVAEGLTDSQSQRN